MLRVHRSDRADTLVSMLADLVAEPLDDPMVPEVVSVPTRGIERWLTQQLSAHLGTSPGRHDGVCANVDFPFPGTLIGRALALASDIDPDADPWSPERSVWPLIELVEQNFEEQWLAPLAQHITNSKTADGSRRFASIRHVADIFDRYAVHRPDMLQRWAEGRAQLDETPWQVELWLSLRERIGQPSPAERLREACARLRREPALLDQPPRLSLFGLTRLPASYLDVLEAMGAERDVHLFLLHPSPALWDRVAGSVGPRSRDVLRAEDGTAAAPRNPLLASWGRDAREMQLVLGAAMEGGAGAEAPSETAPTLLRRIQDDVRADRASRGPGGADSERPLLDPRDDSIRVHSCHGRGRQVEVLRDAILHLLEDDPTLEPRDIIVMCPDIESFAPLIQATFGGHDHNDGSDDTRHALEIRLADRSLRQTNPVMGVLAEVLELTTARITATEVLDLAGREPVRRRFQFGDEDLFRLEEWVEKACVRWGFDAGHRGAFELEGLGNNTWQAGMDRILLGVAMAEEGQRLFCDTLPLDDVDSADIDVAGRMAEFLERLRSALDGLAASRTVDAWAGTLARIADSLAATAPSDAWQRAQLKSLLDELVDEARTGAGMSTVTLGSDDIRAILADRLKGRPTRANFCTGHLTVCTLVPMRSIPHRVVCLLGLDDGTFPRHVERDGDDLTARQPRVGDRDVRGEDRQLLLDALLAARDHLVVTYSGHDERSNLMRPPAVPVGELLDVVDHTVRTPKGRPRDLIKISHPLQPFDKRNYLAGEQVADGPWSFDTLHLAGARAAVGPRQELPPFLSGPLPPAVPDTVGLDQVERFLRHPVRAFLRERLTISLRDKTRDFDDAIPIDLNALERWKIADRMLAARLDGATQASCEAVELARGPLPPGLLADPVLTKISDPLDDLVQAARSATPPRSVEVRVDLPGSPLLLGTVPGVRGDTVHSVTYSRLGPAARLIAWLRLLALSATWPEHAFRAQTIGRANRRGRTVALATVGPLGEDLTSRRMIAEQHLGVLLDLFARGLCEPLPLSCKTSAAWAEAVVAGADAGAAAAAATECWESGWNDPKEDADTEHELVLGAHVSLGRLLAVSGAPRPDEAGWVPAEPTRFGLYARRLWDGLLGCEQVVET